jgi:hypothetical protein
MPWVPTARAVDGGQMHNALRVYIKPSWFFAKVLNRITLATDGRAHINGDRKKDG